MKLRLFHRNKPALAPGIQAPAVRDTLSRVSVACIELTPEGELTDINMQAYKALRLGGGDFPHPLNISACSLSVMIKKTFCPLFSKGWNGTKPTATCRRGAIYSYPAGTI